MRCCNCPYAQPIYEYNCDELPCEVCGLVADKEITENRNGEMGCLFNKRTLDKRYRKAGNNDR